MLKTNNPIVTENLSAQSKGAIAGISRVFSRRTLLLIAGATVAAGISGAGAQDASKTTPQKPRIAVIGSGTVGGTLGKLFVAARYPVIFSSRHPEELRDMARSLGDLASVAPPAEAAAAGEIILMAVPYKALPEVGKQLESQMQGKIVIDATNPYAWRDGDIGRKAEQLGVGAVAATLMPGARIVRAFNTMSTHTIAEQADRAAPHLAIPIAGDDVNAVAVTSTLIRDAGLVPVAVGPLESARLFQPGGPGWQAIGTEAELRRKLSLPAR